MSVPGMVRGVVTNPWSRWSWHQAPMGSACSPDTAGASSLRLSGRKEIPVCSITSCPLTTLCAR
jgi:hypothetical protein